MELKKIAGKSKKGQLMTIMLLVLFILMIAELFAFALLNVTSNSVAQSLAASSSSNNYANLLKLSANSFAKESLDRAINVLANYELTPTLRKYNFITNTTLYISSLVMNGNVPNDTSGYPQNAMGNLTLRNYNNSIANLLGFAGQGVSTNETAPNIFLSDPYHLGITYTEHISLNVSGNRYTYNIPVNATIPLNNTPDLFYAQQGIVRTVKFADLSNITSVIGNTYATSGNALSYAYGTIYSIFSTRSAGASCSGVPTMLQSAPYSTNLIIATYNAVGLEGCENSYAGLISYTPPSTLPTVPYLIYSNLSGMLSQLPTGRKVLLYGPGLETLDIESLQAAIAGNNYFSSPFTSSYLDRAQANLVRQSQNGMFTFSNYNTQGLNLPGISGNKASLTASSYLKPTGAITVLAWAYSKPGSTATENAIVATGVTQSYCGYELQEGNFIVCSSSVNYPSSKFTIGTNSWHMLSGVFNGTLQKIYFYVDANLIGTTSGPSTITYTNPPSIGIGDAPGSGVPFSGVIANVQIYNTSLNSYQIARLFTEGISALPLNNNALVGWWPLNRNARDYSGYNNNGTVANGNFMLLPNYTRDSVFMVPVQTPTNAIPGVLCSNSKSDCSSNLQTQLYLGRMPLEPQGGFLQVGQFNSIVPNEGANSNIQTGSSVTLSSNSFSIGLWFDPRIQCSNYNVGNGREVPLSQNALGGLQNPWVEFFCMHSGAEGNRWTFGVTNTGGTESDIYGNAIIPGAWYFAAMSYDTPSQTISLYLNGTLQGTNTISGYVGTKQPLVFGDGENLFPGNIANIQVYNMTLTPAQVTTLYQEGIAGLPVVPSNLIGWWPLNGDANDYASNNNGIATNVLYPYFTGNYNLPGLSSISVAANEWQALGLANT